MYDIEYFILSFYQLAFRKLSDGIGYFIYRLNQFKLVFIYKKKLLENFF